MLTFITALLVTSGLIILPLKKFSCSRFSLLLVLIPFAAFLSFFSLIPQVAQGNLIQETINWLPGLGISLSLTLDGLSLLFALLITGIGTLIILYSIGYMDRVVYLSRYFSYLFIFMGAMVGVVLADDLILLFVFWEMTSITSFLLIGFNSDKSSAREAATTALLITGAGALSLLVGFVLMHEVTHTYKISEILMQQDQLITSPLYVPIFILIMIGCFTKSAQFPFHFWLPNAMQAPTPVSAYLHSATMVQIGIYLLARLHPVMAGHASWFIVLSTIGAVTMLISAILAFKQDDMKLLLAYTTITALGSLVFLLGSTNEVVIKSAIAFFISHALYKATLFMVVGDIQHQTGTRLLSKISGLRKAMPVTFLATIVAAASMAGLPPLLGFYVKELVYEAKLAAPVASEILTFIVVFANMLIAALAFILVIKPFFGKQQPLNICEANRKMSVNALLLSLMTLVFSIFPFVIDRSILSPAASAVMGQQVTMNLSLWHGFTPSLALSVITLLGAIVLYLQKRKIASWLNSMDGILKYGPSYWWSCLIAGAMSIAAWQTKILQSGKQRVYLTIILASVTSCMLYTIFQQHVYHYDQLTQDFNWLSLFLFIWILSSAIAVVWVHTYLRGLVFLGMFGLGVALLFLVNAAPDVAMTQVLVETLIVIIVVLNISRLPVLPHIVPEPVRLRILNLCIALSLGFTVTTMLLVITHGWFDSFVSDYYQQNAVALAHGRNIVNVILVDFRAIDTLGEIIVVATAAIGIYGLLRLREKGKKT